MTDQTVSDKLGAVLVRVLEQTAFLFADRVDDLDDRALRTTDMIQVSLEFSGARFGQAALILPVKLCSEIYTNMLGTQDRDALCEDSIFDAAKELANIVAGQMLTELYGTSEVFSQSSPAVKPVSMEELLALIETGLSAFAVVDEMPVALIQLAVERKHEHQSTNS